MTDSPDRQYLVNFTPEVFHNILTRLVSPADLLEFYQWVGKHAVREAAADIRQAAAGRPPHGLCPQISTAKNAARHIEEGGPYPLKLPARSLDSLD